MKIMGIALVSALFCIFLKEKTPQFALVVSFITGMVIFFLIADQLKTVIFQLKEMVNQSGVSSQTVNLILKICGIGIGAEFLCNTIADAGETALAKKAEFAAKIVIFVMILPLVGKVVDTVWSLF